MPWRRIVSFETIRYRRWLSLPLIGLDIFYFFRTTPYEVNRFARNVPLEIPKRCCYFSERSFKIQHVRPGLWLAETFFYFPKLLKICHRCSSRGFEEVFFGFLEWIEIQDVFTGRNIFYFFSRKTACYVSRNVSLRDAMSFSNEQNLISAVSPHRMTYQFKFTWAMNKER